MNKIISANYRDRRSSVKWLVRDESQDPTKAEQCKAIIAKNVKFESSNSYENGFGCSMIANAQSAETSEDGLIIPENSIILTFDGMNFVDADEKAIRQVKELYLFEDGRMLAVV